MQWCQFRKHHTAQWFDSRKYIQMDDINECFTHLWYRPSNFYGENCQIEICLKLYNSVHQENDRSISIFWIKCMFSKAWQVRATGFRKSSLLWFRHLCQPVHHYICVLTGAGGQCYICSILRCFSEEKMRNTQITKHCIRNVQVKQLP